LNLNAPPLHKTRSAPSFISWACAAALSTALESPAHRASMPYWWPVSCRSLQRWTLSADRRYGCARRLRMSSPLQSLHNLHWRAIRYLLD